MGNSGWKSVLTRTRARPPGLLVKIMLVGLLVGATGLAGGVVAAAHVSAASQAAACAKVMVVAKPKLNTQAGSTETIKNQITSCASKPEVVQVKQKLRASGVPLNRSFTLSAGETVTITQHIKYVCCGAHSVTDRVLSTSGKRLARDRASWTFA